MALDYVKLDKITTLTSDIMLKNCDTVSEFFLVTLILLAGVVTSDPLEGDLTEEIKQESQEIITTINSKFKSLNIIE